MDKEEDINKNIYPNNINFNNNIIDTQNFVENIEKDMQFESLLNNTSTFSNSNCFQKKINEIKRILKNNNNISACNTHGLPSNIICIDEKKKICSQCALNDIHSNHQIITEKDFLTNIDNLIELFQEIEQNQIKYLSTNNTINVKNIIDNICINIKKLIDLVDETKEKLINSINSQSNKIIKFLNKRKDEIKKKYQNNNFDMNNLRESSLNWINITKNKLNQMNDINETNLDLIKLIDDEQSKNISQLIRSGKQLKDRFLFAQESLKIINNLEQYKCNGIAIEPNINIINSIVDSNKIQDEKDILQDRIFVNGKNHENNEENNKDGIKITLFNVEENYNLIQLLHLQKSEFDNKKKTSSDINQNIKNLNESMSKKLEKSLINIDEIKINEDALLISPQCIIYNNNNISSPKSIKSKIISSQTNSIKKDNTFINKDEDIQSSSTIDYNNSHYKTNCKRPIGIVTKKIAINKAKDNNNNNKSRDKTSSKKKKMESKEKKLMNYYKLNSNESLYTSYSRSPDNRKIQNYQSINAEKTSWNNSNFKKQKRIKVGLKMNYYLYKNKEKDTYAKTITNKSNLSVRKNNVGSRRGSKEKENQNHLNMTSINKKSVKKSSNKLTLRNRKSKNSFSSLYSGQFLLESNYNNKTNNITNSGDKNEESKENFIKFNINHHYDNLYKSNNSIGDTNNSNTPNEIIKKNIMLTNNIKLINKEKNEIRTKKELNKIIIAQMKSLNPNFNGINMSGTGVQLLCNYLFKNPNKVYKEMKLLGCNLTDDDLLLLIKTLLEQNVNIVLLNLSDNKISDESAPNLLDLLKEHKTLKRLTLYNNLISDLLKDKLKKYTELGRENLHSIQLYI